MPHLFRGHARIPPPFRGTGPRKVNDFQKGLLVKFTAILAALALTVGLSAPATAAVIGLRVEGGGTQQVYQLSNGNFLGLWGFDNREIANPGKGDVTISAASQIIAGFSGGASRIVAFYNGATPVNPGAKEFDPLDFGFTIADNARLFNSLWIEWKSGTLVYRQPAGGTTSMAARATRDGDPFAITPVPVPAALPLLLAGVGALALVARRRKTAA